MLIVVFQSSTAVRLPWLTLPWMLGNLTLCPVRSASIATTRRRRTRTARRITSGEAKGSTKFQQFHEFSMSSCHPMFFVQVLINTQQSHLGDGVHWFPELFFAGQMLREVRPRGHNLYNTASWSSLSSPHTAGGIVGLLHLLCVFP